MKLRLFFYLLSLLTLSVSCNQEIKEDKKYTPSNYEFKTTEAREIYTQCLAYDLVDINKLREFAQNLVNLQNDEDAKTIGTFYLLLSEFYSKGEAISLNKLLKFYKQIPERKYDKIRFRIDFITISYYYHTSNYEGIAERIDLLSNYISRPEHWLERTTFKFYISFQENEKDYARLIADFIKIEENLKEYPWGYYQNLIYKSIANTYVRINDEISAKEKFDYAINENNKSGKIILNITVINDVFYQLDDTIAILKEAEKIIFQSGYTKDLSLIYRLKGHSYSNSSNFDQAFKQYDMAAIHDSISNRMESYVFSNVYRGWSYYKKDPSIKSYKKSLVYYNLAEQKADLIRNPKNYLQEIINRKIWALGDIGTKDELNDAKAEFYNLYYSKLGQKINTNIIKRVVSNFNLQLSVKENEVDYLKNNESLNKQKIESQRIILSLAAIALILLLSLIGFNYNRIKKAKEIKSKNQIINTQNIELQNSILKLSENTKVLQEILDRRDKIIVRLKQFTYTLAHDLSDPLLAIKTFGFLLKNTVTSKLTSKESEFLDVILDASMRLSDKVERLYKYSTNTLILFNDFKPINLNTIIQGIIKDLSIIIKDKKAQITSDSIPPIKGDDVLINQLFQNLISNALKYNKVGVQPIIHISSYEENNELIIIVKDNGIGIEKQSNTDIFKLFQRAKQDKKTKGKGIGLAIAKETVEIHNGRIWFDSDPVNGTTFFIAFKEYGENIKSSKLFEASEA